MTRILLITVLIGSASVFCDPIEYKYQKCCPEHQMLDIQSKTCQDTTEDLSKIEVDPHVTAPSLIKINKTSVASSFALPTCEGEDKLIVLKPFNGQNSDYNVYYQGKEKGLIRNCEPTVPIWPNQNKYCFDRGFNQDDHESTVAVICGQPKTCIRTCCQPGQYFSRNGSCIDHTTEPDQPWTIEFTDDPNATYHTFTNRPCSNGGSLENETKHEWHFESNGDLTISLATYSYDQYCLNHAQDQNGNFTKEIFVCEVENQACHGEFQSWKCAVDLTLIPILMGFSLFFLILLQWIIWTEKKQNLYECMQLCNIFMLTLVYLTLIIIKQVKSTDLPSALCEILGLVFQFSYMSSLFWLSAMSYFVFNAFKGMTSNPKNLQKKKYGFNHPKFKFFALYAFGCPALVIVVTIILQHLPEDYQEGYIAPRINNGTCLLGDSRGGFDIPQLWYFHVINIFTLLSTLAFFVIFVWKITVGFWATTTTSATDQEKAEKRRQRMKVVFKMFLVMGLTWIADIASWAINSQYGHFEKFKNKGLLYSEVFCDCINSLQGVILFLVVYFDQKRIKNLKERISSSGGTMSTTSGKTNGIEMNARSKN